MANHLHDGYRGRSEVVLALTIIFLILVSLFVILRIVSRTAIVKKVGLDDYFIILAWAIAFGLSFCICYGCLYGLGRHEADIPPEWQYSLNRVDYAFTVLYQPALMAEKSSILAFYLVLPTKNPIFKWACLGTLFVVNAGGLALTLVTVFQCHPVSAAFDFLTPTSAHCTDIVTIYLSSAPLNIITDLALVFLPMPILTSMHLPRKQKIILVVTFGFGIFAAVVDVVRIAYLQSAATARLLRSKHRIGHSGPSLQSEKHNDFSWYGSLSFMWSAIEVDIGILCACVPALKPLVTRFMPNLLHGAGDAKRNMSEDLDTMLSNGSIGEDSQLTRPAPVASPTISQTHTTANDAYRPPTAGDSLDMIEFLTTPETKGLPHLKRDETAMANSSDHKSSAQSNFFDFVSMTQTKSLVHMRNRESIFPIAMVTILFFIWGFEYGLIDVLNTQFERIAHMSVGQSTGIHSAYWAGYIAGPLLIGRLVLTRWGFKACFIVGLAIYACGTLIFWPSAVLTSFPAFLITNFIVAMGLSILEVAANPFIVLCGPPEYAEVRLSLSQAVQAIGSVVAPLIANRAFFRSKLDAKLLVNAQWAYLGIALVTILLAVAYYYVPLPEATNAELEAMVDRAGNAHRAEIRGVRIIWITLAFGMFSQFCYVGGQEVNITIFDKYMSTVAPQKSSSNFLAVAHTAFAVSRFTAAGLGLLVKPRYLLLFFYLGAIVFDVLAMNFSGNTGTAMIVMVFFMEGPLFPLIFAQALRGQGQYTKLASVGITAAIGGGAVFSPISSQLASEQRAMYSLVIAVAAFAGGSIFAIYLNAVPQARAHVDPLKRDTAQQLHADRKASVPDAAIKVWDFVSSPTWKKTSGETPSLQTEWKENATHYKL